MTVFLHERKYLLHSIVPYTPSNTNENILRNPHCNKYPFHVGILITTADYYLGR